MKFLGTRIGLIPALALTILGATASNSFALVDPVNQYRLNQWTGVTDDFGGPNLTTYGGLTGQNAAVCTSVGSPTQCQEGYAFGKGQGLSVAGLGISDTYTIVIDFMLNEGQGFQKILDFSNLCNTDPSCNAGLYVSAKTSESTRKLSFVRDDSIIYGGNNGTQAQQIMSRVTITRSGATDRTRIYDDGVPAGGGADGTPPCCLANMSWIDTASDSIFTGPNGIINFFMDDMITGGTVAGSGFVDTIRIFDVALTSDEIIAELGEVSDVPPAVVPEPASLLLVGAGLAFAARGIRRRTVKA